VIIIVFGALFGGAAGVHTSTGYPRCSTTCPRSPPCPC
jgi:hypothetical protein